MSNIDFFIKNGNVVVGENSKVDGLSVIITNYKKNEPYIIIGSNCMINGSVTIYNQGAKVKIGDRVFIGPNTDLMCNDSITIESDVMLSWGITMIDTDAHSLNWEDRKNDVIDWIKGENFKNWNVVKSKPIVIQSKSWIGFKSIILKGVTVSSGTIVGAGSVVTRNTEKYTVVAGNPAKCIKKTH